MTAILLVGEELSKDLKPYFEQIGYGEESVSCAHSIGSAIRAIRKLRPMTVVMHSDGNREDEEHLCSAAKNANNLARVIAFRATPGADCADIVLPWPVDFDKFFDTLHTVIEEYATVPRVGFRGAFRVTPPTPKAEHGNPIL